VHPAAHLRRLTDRAPRQRLVRLATGDHEQVLPELLFGVGLGQHVLRHVVHAAQVARMARIAAAPCARRSPEQQHRCACLARDERRTMCGVAATDHEDVDHHRCRCFSTAASIGQRRGEPARATATPPGCGAGAATDGDSWPLTHGDPA